MIILMQRQTTSKQEEISSKGELKDLGHCSKVQVTGTPHRLGIISNVQASGD